MSQDAMDRWQKAVEWPLVIAAVLFLLAYAAEVLVEPGGWVTVLIDVVVWGTWGMFAVDYLVRLYLAPEPGRWFIHHLLDLAIVVLPMLRPLRLMRFLTILALLQRGAGTLLRGRVVIYTIVTTTTVVILAALAVYDAEKAGPGAIDSFGDALWWAFVTITTVGYGDMAPVTTTGRIIAIGLMIGGIALIGVVTATLASWIVEKVTLESEKTAAASEAQVEQLREEIRQLTQLVRDKS